ncbi:PP0621 family protein [Roseateles sp.]|uniref:PP0621 family protein n=1 Tax=Roseateles sp. TaxID=1971397 RepID=UPI00393BFE99
MKYLLLLILLAVVFYMLGRKRQPPPAQPPASSAPPTVGRGQPMVACAHCGLHLPEQESLPGRGGAFCSAEHRAAYEAANARP